MLIDALAAHPGEVASASVIPFVLTAALVWLFIERLKKKKRETQ